MLTLSCEDNTNQFKSLSFALQNANYKLSLNKQEPNALPYIMESLILAQDERWRRA